MADHRVLLIVHHFPPSNAAGVFRTLRFAKYLPEFGWSPIVMTATPHDLSDTDSLPTDREILSILPPNTRVERVIQSSGKHRYRSSNAKQLDSGTTPRRNNRLRMTMRNAWQALTQTPDRHIGWAGPAVLRGRRLIEQEQPKILYTSGPPHSVHLVGSVLKRMAGTPWVADLRDPWARRPWKRDENPWGERLAARIERFCMTRADAVVLNTEYAASDFRNTYHDLPSEKFQVIPNGFDPDLLKLARELTHQKRENSSGKLRLLHPGSCYGRRNPRTVVDAVSDLARSGIHVHFEQVGHCASQFALQDYAKYHGVEDRVSVEDTVPHARILERMSTTDVLLLIQPEAPLMVPGKLYEMIPFRKPIIAITDEGATADVIRRFELGFVVPSGDPTALAAAVKRLARPGMSMPKASENVDAALHAFDGKELTGTLATVFESLVRQRPSAAMPHPTDRVSQKSF